MTRREAVLAEPRIDSPTAEFEPVKRFVGWLAGELVGLPVRVDVVAKLSTDLGPAIATWQEGCILTLNASHHTEWDLPINEHFLGILVHEVAHHRAPHHGDDFRKETERMAGKLALMCIQRGHEILSRWATANADANASHA